MSARPRLIRSIPFWVLIAGSLATSAVGAWIINDKLTVMSATLTDGTATGLEVYVGQVWAIVGGILIATGLIGLALSLVLGAISSLVPVPAVEVVEEIDWTAESSDDDAALAAALVAPPAGYTAPAEGAAQAAGSADVAAEDTAAPQR